jgi:hypothetical protein
MPGGEATVGGYINSIISEHITERNPRTVQKRRNFWRRTRTGRFGYSSGRDTEETDADEESEDLRQMLEQESATELANGFSIEEMETAANNQSDGRKRGTSLSGR